MCFSNFRRILIIILFLSFSLMILTACHRLAPIRRQQSHDTENWTFQKISQWFTKKRVDLRQITIWARVTITNEKTKEGFDAFISLNNKGEGRIEGLGPWRNPFFNLIYNQRGVYFYLPGESRLYLCQNNPEHMQRLLGLPVNLSSLFNLLSSTLPENLSVCTKKDFTNEGSTFFCLSGKGHNMDCRAKVKIEGFPIIDELVCEGSIVKESFRVKYNDIQDIDGYVFPKNIYIVWTGNQELQIHLRSVNLNSPVPSSIYLPDVSWFSGEVIYLYDKGLNNDKISGD